MKKNIRSNLTIMCGYRKSGRSEYVKKIQKLKTSFYLICFDETAKENYGKLDLNVQEEKEVYMECLNRILEIISEGNNVIFDSANLSIKQRNILLKSVRNHCRRKAIRCWLSIMCFPLSYSECFVKMDIEERNASMSDKKRLEMPEQKEGWNDIWIYDIHKKIFRQIKCHDKLII